ncbi:DUF1353 domain-containing protein [Micropruina sp.]|uniref:DUF1353 domain-containing protein n=1 Tax=Micropruina sp. TaxID=2737536 RepID=UPI0039E67C7F
MPFALPAGDDSSTTGVQLRIDTPRIFTLTTPLWYAPRRSLSPVLDAALPPTPSDAPDEAHRWLKIGDEKTPPTTDLGSVPGVLWGLIASYGRHTLAVLVHDQLCDHNEAGPSDQRFVRRTAADEIFHQARRDHDPDRPDFQAPPFRSLVLWAGVSAGRYWTTRRAGFAALAGATLGLWVAGWWALQSAPGPAQPLAAWVLLLAGLALLGVAGWADARVRATGRRGDRWVGRALVVGVLLLLASSAWASTPWPPLFGFVVPGWLALLGGLAFLGGSAALAASPVRRDALLPLLAAVTGPAVGLVAGVTIAVLYLLWIPDVFARNSCGPINTVDSPSNTLRGPRN